MFESTYKLIPIVSGTKYKPTWVNKNPQFQNNAKMSLENGAGYYNQPLIYKFLVAVNTASAIKIWTVDMDPEDDNAGISIAPGAFLAGHEYSIAIARIDFTGTFSAYGYCAKNIPHDYSSF